MKKEQIIFGIYPRYAPSWSVFSKFMSLSAWAGIMAGMYAWAEAYVDSQVFNFTAYDTAFSTIKSGSLSSGLLKVIFLPL